MLTHARVRELLKLYAEGWTLGPLAQRYEVSMATVSRVLTGKIWTDVTGGRNVSRTGRDTEARVAYIEARLQQGCRNHAKIAEELGISRQAVAKLISTRNLGGNSCSVA